MVFNTPEFLIFLAVCAVAYYAVPNKWQNAFLLFISYLCYMWAIPQYGILIAATTTFSYFIARAIHKTESSKNRKILFLSGIVALLLILAIFKYFNFFMGSLSAVFRIFGAELFVISTSWILPVGISFYTFQVVGYLIDVYNKVTPPEENFISFALYVSFFPQVLAGPIGRSRELLPQYKNARQFNYHDVICGSQRFLTGLFKKVVLADGLAIIVDGIYGSLSEYSGFSLIIAVVLYAVQLYFDFSGYSDMAIASAQILGITLRENFVAPYFSTNVSGFWKRWHMSLTSWFNDYVFTPLVWSRWINKIAFGKNWNDHSPHFMINIIIIFMISGLWHGAGWTFVIWGLLNGFFRVAEELIHKIKPLKKKTQTLFVIVSKRCFVFMIFALSLVFFRAQTISDAVYVLKNFISPTQASVVIEQLLHLSSNGISTSGIYIAIYWVILGTGIFFGTWFDYKVNRSSLAKGTALLKNPVGTYSKKMRWALYWFMGISTMLFYFIGLTGQRGSGSFIYFGF